MESTLGESEAETPAKSVNHTVAADGTKSSKEIEKMDVEKKVRMYLSYSFSRSIVCKANVEEQLYSYIA